MWGYFCFVVAPSTDVLSAVLNLKRCPFKWQSYWQACHLSCPDSIELDSLTVLWAEGSKRKLFVCLSWSQLAIFVAVSLLSIAYSMPCNSQRCHKQAQVLWMGAGSPFLNLIRNLIFFSPLCPGTHNKVQLFMPVYNSYLHFKWHFTMFYNIRR